MICAAPPTVRNEEATGLVGIGGGAPHAPAAISQSTEFSVVLAGFVIWLVTGKALPRTTPAGAVKDAINAGVCETAPVAVAWYPPGNVAVRTKPVAPAGTFTTGPWRFEGGPAGKVNVHASVASERLPLVALASALPPVATVNVPPASLQVPVNPE